MLNAYILECKALQEQLTQQTPIQKLISQCQNNLNPNDYSLSFFESLRQTLKEPMQIAIIGQFSSGKSTFLNALLGQDILPTGITPITAKVCKICYGEDYVLEILYKDGKKVLQNVESLHKMTRENSKNIAHFCLYAPILLLKEMNFLDTPGFNSQNSEDAHITLKTLRNVDGIIWLTLIDNVGKNSEKTLLKELGRRFAQKSLCVLNQKDRLKNPTEIQMSVAYAKSAFSGIFCDVIPVSAKLALKARLNTTEKLLETALLTLAHNIQDLALKDSALNQPSKTLEVLETLFNNTHAYLKESLQTTKESSTAMQDSNMPLVFNFLYQTIQPKANRAKSHSALKKLKELHVRLHLQYHKIHQRYKSLEAILTQNVTSNLESCKTSKAKEQEILHALYSNLDLLLDRLAQKIFSALEQRTIPFVQYQKTFFGKKPITQNKAVTFLPLENLRLTLQNQDSKFVKDYKAISIKIKKFLDVFATSMQQNTNTLTKNITQWQEETLSYIESNCIESQALQDLRAFIQNCYKHLLVDFNHNAFTAISFLQSELNALSYFLSLNYHNAIDLTLTNLDGRIKNAIAKHKENQEEFALFNPTLENIREVLNNAFCFEHLQSKLFDPMNALNKAYGHFLEQNATTTEKKLQNINAVSCSLKKESDKIMQNLVLIKSGIEFA